MQRESKSCLINLMDLGNIAISLNESNSFTSCVQGMSTRQQRKDENNEKKQNLHQEQELQLQPQSPPPPPPSQFLLAITFYLVQPTPLTPLHPPIPLFQLTCPSLQLQITTHLRLSKLFHLETLSYFMEMESFCFIGKAVEKGYVKVRTRDFGTYAKHEIEVRFVVEGEGLEEVFDGQEGDGGALLAGLVLGKKGNRWAFGVEGFRVTLERDTSHQQLSNQLQKPIIPNFSLPQNYSYPLIDKLQLLLQNQQALNLLPSIHSLPPYISPCPAPHPNPLYICHDMKGGYIQDTNTFTPLPIFSLVPSKSHHYRYNYLSQTTIFNYFSHYPITIPPKMWRQLCRSYNVLCLGTFIVEPNELAMSEEQFLTQEFAMKLVYIARKAKFDGYLINIEIPVENPTRVITWLKFLTQTMNTAIPGSHIIWYDSILMTGQIKYQNQLNTHNQPFYQACNGIFTNYWWTQASLTTSLTHKLPHKPIFIGNDCFGRNTYGGGKYDIGKAVSRIVELGKGELGVGLFAPGFTYEDGGESVRERFRQNQVRMYRGRKVDRRVIEKWKVTQNGGQGWKQEGEWWVTSHQLCKRQALVKISDYKSLTPTLLHATFSCLITGTGPNHADHYTITLQLYNYKTSQVLQQSTHPKTTTSQRQQRVEIQMVIDCQMLSDSVCLRILEEGKDAEVWAGHYGARFKGEEVGLVLDGGESDWVKRIGVKAVGLGQKGNYTTFFNMGEGDRFYSMGDKKQSSYDCLQDYDIPPVLVLNPISCVQISYQDSYIGGTCLKYHNTNKIMMNKFILHFEKKSELDKQVKYVALIVAKNTQPLEIIVSNANIKAWFKAILSYGEKNKDKESKDNWQNVQNGWKLFVSETLTFSNNSESVPQFGAQIRFSQNAGLIGQFSLFSESQCSLFSCQKQNKEVKPTIPVCLKLSLNKQSSHTLPYCLDLVLQKRESSQNIQIFHHIIPKRLLIRTGGFAGFIHLSHNSQQQLLYIQKDIGILGMLRQIPVIQSLYGSVQIQIIDLERGFDCVFRETLNRKEISRLLNGHEVCCDFFV